MNTFEIYFSDLNDNAKARLLQAVGAKRDGASPLSGTEIL